MNAQLVCVLVLAAGTYAFRLAGPLLHGRVELPARFQELLTTGATVILVALLVTGAVAEGQEFAGLSRPAGVLVGGVLAWRRAPFVMVVMGAAGATALLRLAGLS
ncbi:AzlD domain-containing protein [Streptomyces sp. NPDC059063]|uniref:AzlD domain-containing protein n=1 Tax=unclassified Streptomyces TaxID=2593676 RepID=UPI0036BB133C